MKNTNNSKFKNVLKSILLSNLLLLSYSNLFAQFGWETLYNTSQTTFGRKGCLNPDSSQFFASTGRTKTTGCIPQAFLMETNLRGVVNWTINLGDQDYYFEGLSVKSTTDGGYIVVGKTTKDQVFPGPPTGSDCDEYIPYYNAFISYYNHNSPWLNWTQVFGNENLNDYATEVVEDSSGNFVVTGIANEKFSGTCYSSSQFVHQPGYKSSKVLFSVFNSIGTNLVNNAYGLDSFHYEARNIMQASTGDIIVTSSVRPHNLNIVGFLPYFYTTNILQYSNMYNLINSHVYGTHFATDRRPYQTIETPTGFLIGGEELNLQQDAVSSYLIYTDPNFNPLGFGSIRNIGYQGKILLRDIELIDSFNYLISGDYFDSLNLAFETDYFAMKIRWDGALFYGVNSAVSNGNLAHYHQSNEKHANTIEYYNEDGNLRYHLFGNSKNSNTNFNQAYYVDVDINLQSGCELWDSVDVGNILMEYVTDSIGYDTLQVMTPFLIDSLEMLRFPVCDNYPYFVVGNGDGSVQKIMNVNGSKIESKLFVYPNPTDNQLKIKLDGTSLNGNEATIKIYNSAGILLKEINHIQIKDGMDLITINTHEFIPGLYIGIIVNEGKLEMFKFIKQ